MTGPAALRDRPRGTWASMAAVNPDGVIGIDGALPWRYPGDLRRLNRLTRGTTVIMGRRTWESLPRRPMKGRRNIVLSRAPVEGAETFASLPAALAACEGDVWFLGGTRVYEEAMDYADFLDMTYVPDRFAARPGQEVALFPPISETVWQPGPRAPDPDEPAVERRVFTRRKEASP